MLSESPGPKVYSISTLTEEIKELLEEKFDFVWVEGEVSRLRALLHGPER